MNINELCVKIAGQTGESATAVRATLDAAFDEIAAALASGKEVAVPGFGVFQVRERPARTGRNPRTGEPLHIKAGRAPAFKAYSALKAQVNID